MHSNFLQEEIVAAMRAQFGHLALFFWNGITGDSIHIVWKPAAFIPQSFGILDCAVGFPLPDLNEGGNNGGEGAGLMAFNALEIIGRILSLCNGYASSFVRI